MLNLKMVNFGINRLLVPEVFKNYNNINIYNIPRYCGAGRGIGEFVVPDNILFCNVRICCFFHDICWNLAFPEYREFHYSNSAFKINMRTVILNNKTVSFINKFRIFIARKYFDTVDIAGSKIFWNLKEEQKIHKYQRVNDLYLTLMPVYKEKTPKLIEELLANL